MRPLRRWRAAAAWRQRLGAPPARPRGAFNGDAGARLLLMFSLDDPSATAAARAFAKTHRERGAEVRELSYAAADLPKEQRSPERWGPATLGFAGLPTPTAEEPWRGRDYDLVVHCALAPFAPFDYLAAGLRAHRRVAAYDAALECYDLVVTPPAGGGVAEFLAETERVLALLNPDYAD